MVVGGFRSFHVLVITIFSHYYYYMYNQFYHVLRIR